MDTDDLMTQTIYDYLTSHFETADCETMARELAFEIRDAYDEKRAATLRGPSTVKTSAYFPEDYHSGISRPAR